MYALLAYNWMPKTKEMPKFDQIVTAVKKKS